MASWGQKVVQNISFYQSAHGLAFYPDETRKRVMEYCVLSIRMAGKRTVIPQGIGTKSIGTPTAKAVWGMFMTNKYYIDQLIARGPAASKRQKLIK